MKKGPCLKIEKQYLKKGFNLIVGVDESGRGSWAGPVVAGAVILGKRRIYNLNDSKLLSKKQRELLYYEIIKYALDWSVGIVEVEEIDKLGVGKASILAMKRAVLGLKNSPQLILVDAFDDIGISEIPTIGIKFGDRLSSSIAAASIIAKVERDRIMEKLHQKYPHYQFEKHKGYGTALHRFLIEKHGISPVHRRSFAPIKNLLKHE